MAPSDPTGLFELLCSHEVEMIVIGGQAAVIHGNFVPAGTRGFADLRRDARSISLGEITVLVASLDDVIRSKRAAGRPKDQAALPMLEALREASR